MVFGLRANTADYWQEKGGVLPGQKRARGPGRGSVEHGRAKTITMVIISVADVSAHPDHHLQGRASAQRDVSTPQWDESTPEASQSPTLRQAAVQSAGASTFVHILSPKYTREESVEMARQPPDGQEAPSRPRRPSRSRQGEA